MMYQLQDQISVVLWVDVIFKKPNCNTQFLQFLNHIERLEDIPRKAVMLCAPDLLNADFPALDVTQQTLEPGAVKGFGRGIIGVV
jgi:ABC-type thiamine transport system substrate-binding protein